MHPVFINKRTKRGGKRHLDNKLQRRKYHWLLPSPFSKIRRLRDDPIKAAWKVHEKKKENRDNGKNKEFAQAVRFRVM